ncbi:MAG: hypothetical protein HY591_03270 [Candidatus Omnitrophica bacterium]|nr:hypothetical protein [Candidatus Omnitrophota bacterium]
MANPFNVFKVKESIKNSILKIKTVPDSNHAEDLFTMSLALCAGVKRIFFEKSEAVFSNEPVIEKKLIIQFMQRMRIDGMEKFDQTTVLSAVHFYKDAADLASSLPAGVMIVYIERKFVPEMLRLFKYPYIDYDDDTEVLDGAGAIVNLIAGQFKKELGRLGYADLQMSPFKSYINSSVNGVEYPRSQTHKYEISFEVDDKKRMVVEMVMAPLSKQ